MKIIYVLPKAFGKFRLSQPISFHDGLNIISGENEAGKSTIATFILGMLYGFKKEGIRRISRTPEFERYKPWFGQEYCGVLVYRSGNKIYRVERSFIPDSIKIYDDNTGEDLSKLFSWDSRKELDLPTNTWGCLPGNLKTPWIGQLGNAIEGPWQGLPQQIR